ncbi:hypothetical protein FQA39_LY01687 [Lamprigera yunnana]|nr:hypothetical protein FQA39_LY01687 [Lamprigera yunnana]
MNITTSMVTNTFSWIDYTVFALMLLLSVVIGMYFGFFGPKQDNKAMYLLGGKNMNVVPVAISLVARKVRVLASCMYTITIFVYNPIIIYIPSLAFSQVTGINVFYITPVVCAICIFYTTIGGLKAVVWTDAFQFVGIVVSILVVFILGVNAAGGIKSVWNIAVEGERLELDFSWDPTKRDSFWSIIIGGTINYMPYLTLNQGTMQKYLALSTFSDVKRTAVLYAIGMLFSMSLTIFSGNIVYANYWNCDPLSSNQVQRSDQLIVHLLMDVAGDIPVIPGLFIAGIFAASLRYSSSLSASLNTISSTIYEDFISLFLPKDISEKKASNILKLIVVVMGLVSICLIFLLEKLGSVFQVYVTLQGVANGPLLALFTLGVLCLFINAKGAFYGGLSGLLFAGCLGIGNQYYKSKNMINTYAKPISTAGCNFTFEPRPIIEVIEEPFVLFRISMWYMSLVGALWVFIFGSVISLLTRKSSAPVKPELIFPLLRRFATSKQTKFQISGIAILSIPADIYLYGSNYMWTLLNAPVICLISIIIYLPIFFKLQLTSIYEYFNLRFDRKVRVLASCMYTITIFVYNPIIIYIPSLAFSQVTGINVFYITPAVCAICIFYTTIGGLKAVVWTDAFQFVGIVVSILVVFILGVNAAGGIKSVWNIAVEGERLELDWDPTKRDSFWSIIIGGTINYMPYLTLNQGTMQKYLALSTFSDVKRTAVLYAIGMLFSMSLTIFSGNIMYANYWNCDPLSSNQVQRSDQLIVHLLMDVAGDIPVIPGLFIAGIFAASLRYSSSLSASLNTISSTIYEDFISPFLPKDISEKKASNILKLIVVVMGLVSICLIFLLEKLGSVFQVYVTLQGVANGPLLALFTLGVLCPFINAKGAFYGGLSGLLFAGCLGIGNQYYKSKNMIITYAKPISTAGCNFTFEPRPIIEVTEEPFVLFRISMWYMSLVGALWVFIFGSVISLLTRKSSAPVKPELIFPLLRRFATSKQTKL